jgi:hypothetical protein
MEGAPFEVEMSMKVRCPTNTLNKLYQFFTYISNKICPHNTSLNQCCEGISFI